MKKRICILGDIHGRRIWRDILEKETPDQVVFLGDYVTSHDPQVKPSTQLRELKAILDLKESNPNNITLLRGNHDLDGLGYLWAACYPEVPEEIGKTLSKPEFRDRFLALTQWVCELPAGRYICSHAGLSRVWMEDSMGMFMDSLDWDTLNSIPPDGRFGFCPGNRWDTYGDSSTQSCTWIRPNALIHCAIPGYHQIVGHTQTWGPARKMKMDNKYDLWCCDALEWGGYLIAEIQGEDIQIIPSTIPPEED